MSNYIMAELARLRRTIEQAADPRDQTIAELRARLARERRSNAELARANGVLRDIVAKGD